MFVLKGLLLDQEAFLLHNCRLNLSGDDGLQVSHCSLNRLSIFCVLNIRVDLLMHQVLLVFLNHL